MIDGRLNCPSPPSFPIMIQHRSLPGARTAFVHGFVESRIRSRKTMTLRSGQIQIKRCSLKLYRLKMGEAVFPGTEPTMVVIAPIVFKCGHNLG